MSIYFYVVRIEDSDIRSCLDSIRVICNPSIKGSAHITIRGPYKRQQNFSKISDQIKKETVSILNAGYFFSDTQNTVFLHCGFPGVDNIWKKPDYLSKKPHLTIFDGRDRKLAKGLFAVLRENQFLFNFRPSGLEALRSDSGQTDFDWISNFDFKLIEDIIGTKMTLPEIKKISVELRLKYAKMIWNHLSNHVSGRVL